MILRVGNRSLTPQKEIDPEDILPGELVRVSSKVLEFLKKEGKNEDVFQCSIFEVTIEEESNFTDYLNFHDFGDKHDFEKQTLDPNQVRSVLVHLGTRGHRHLKILRKEEDEKATLLFYGHVVVNGQKTLLLLEHKKEADGKVITLDFVNLEHQKKGRVLVIRTL